MKIKCCFFVLLFVYVILVGALFVKIHSIWNVELGEAIASIKASLQDNRRSEYKSFKIDTTTSVAVNGGVKATHSNNDKAKWLNSTWPFPMEIVDQNICRLYEENRVVDIIILIISRRKETLYRKAVRETWCSHTKRNTANVRCAFLIGDNSMMRIKRDWSLIREATEYKDIVLGNFVDDYKNCTLKVMMGFRWVEQHCSHAKIVLKADVDIWLDVPHVLELVRTENFTSTLAGNCFLAAPNRERESKWYISEKDFSNTSYGMICLGAAYLMTVSDIKQILRIAPSVPFVWMEDVYISLCAQKLNFEIRNIPWNNSSTNDRGYCAFKSGARRMIHVRQLHKLRKMWKALCT